MITPSVKSVFLGLLLLAVNQAAWAGPKSRDLICNTLIDSSQAYLETANRYPPLNREEQVSLALEYRKTKDPKIHQKLLNYNLHLAAHLAKLLPTGPLLELDDKMQLAVIGLSEAIKQWDPEQGSLSTYAGYFVRSETFGAISKNNRIIRVKSNRAKKALEWVEQHQNELATLGPDVNQAAAMGVSSKVALRLARFYGIFGTRLSGTRKVGYWDALGENETIESSWHDYVMQHHPAEDLPFEKKLDAIYMQEFAILLRQGLRTLSAIEQIIIEKNILAEPADYMSKKELAEMFNKSPTRIYQQRNRALQKLRTFLKHQGFESPFERLYR